ncbi:MAG: trypsin-like peptidase domain-containing protein [Deltaproteobacteria bacterium]|nr:trypsin-like peptidase domain-containing protein [Deltaproteobacteria bacterium]
MDCMFRVFLVGAFVSCVLRASIVQPFLVFEHDKRMDRYQMTDERLLQYANSTFTFVKKEMLTRGPNGKYRFSRMKTHKENLNLCPGERFGEQPAPGTFCTGFIATADLAVTAGHCIESDELTNFCDKYLLLFDYSMADVSTANVEFDDSQVLACESVVAREFHSRPFGPGGDYAILRLRHGVVNRKPIPIHRGELDNKAIISTIGYPKGLPQKFVLSSTVVDNEHDYFFSTDTDILHGNSGGPAINLQTYEIEGIAVRLNGIIEKDTFDGDYILDRRRNCRRLFVCKQSEGCQASVDWTRASSFARALSQ